MTYEKMYILVTNTVVWETYRLHFHYLLLLQLTNGSSGFLREAVTCQLVYEV